MKKIGNLKGQFADKDDTPINLWWPRIVGIGLAVLLLGAISFVPILLDAISTIPLLVGVVVVAAIAFFWKGIAGVIAVRWCARTVGVVSAILLATILIGDSLGGHGPKFATIADWLSIAEFATVFVGIVIAFFWEGIGGVLVALAALAMQIKVTVTFQGELNPFLLVFVFVGLASIYCWWRTRRQSLTSQPAT